MYETSQNSEGSAQVELDKYLDSVEGKMTQFQNKIQEMTASLMSSDFLKGTLDVLNAILDVVNAITSAFGGWSLAIPIGIIESIKEFRGNSSLLANLDNGIKKISGQAYAEEQKRKIANTATRATSAGASATETAANEADAASERNLAEATQEVITAKTQEQASIETSNAAKVEETATNTADAASKEIDNSATMQNTSAEFENAGASGTAAAANQIETESIREETAARQANTAAMELENGVKKGSEKGVGGLIAAWKPLLPVLAGVAAAFAAIKLGQWAFDEFIDYGAASQRADEAFNEYEEAQSKVESLNEELSKTQERIEELEGKGSLTLVEQNELSNLKRQNDLLQEQVKLQENIAQIKQKESDKKVLKALSKDNVEDLTSGDTNLINAGVQHSTDTIENVTKNEIQAHKDLLAEKLKLTEEYNKETDKARKKQLKKEIDQNEKALQEIDQDLLKNVDDISNKYEQIKDSTDNAVKEKAQDLANLLKEYADMDLTPVEAARKNLDEFMGKQGTGMDQLKSVFQEAVNQGKSLDDVCKELGFTLSDLPEAGRQALQDYFNSFSAGMTDSLNLLSLNINDLITDDSSATSRVEKAFTDSNDAQFRERGATYDTMLERIKTAKELYKNGEIGTEKWKSVASWANAYGMATPESWEKDSKTLGRYFTADSNTGMYNFMDDLVTSINKEYGEGTAQKTPDEYILPDFFDAEKVGKHMNGGKGLGKEALVAIMGEAQDHGLSQDFFTDEESGMQTLIGLNKDLLQAKMDLENLKPNSEEYKGKKEEIQDYENRIKDATKSMTMLQEAENQLAEKKEPSKEEKQNINDAVNKFKELDKKYKDNAAWTSQRGELIQAIQQQQTAAGIEGVVGYNKLGNFTTDVEGSDKRIDENMNAVSKYQNAQRYKDSKDGPGKQFYDDALKNLRDVYNKRKEDTGYNKSFDDFVKQYGVDAQGRVLSQEEQDKLNATDTQNNTDALEGATDALNSLPDAIQALVEVLGLSSEEYKEAKERAKQERIEEQKKEKEAEKTTTSSESTETSTQPTGSKAGMPTNIPTTTTTRRVPRQHNDVDPNDSSTKEWTGSKAGMPTNLNGTKPTPFPDTATKPDFQDRLRSALLDNPVTRFGERVNGALDRGGQALSNWKDKWFGGGSNKETKIEPKGDVVVEPGKGQSGNILSGSMVASGGGVISDRGPIAGKPSDVVQIPQSGANAQNGGFVSQFFGAIKGLFTGGKKDDTSAIGGKQETKGSTVEQKVETTSTVEVNDKAIQDAKKDAKSLDGENIQVDVSADNSELEESKDKVDEIDGENPTVDVETNDSSVDEAEGKVESLDGTTAEATVNVNDNQVQQADAEIDNMGGTATVNVKVNKAEKVGDQTATGTVNWKNNSAAVDTYKSAQKTAIGVVNWHNNTSSVKTTFSASGKITWTLSQGTIDAAHKKLERLADAKKKREKAKKEAEKKKQQQKQQNNNKGGSSGAHFFRGTVGRSRGTNAYAKGSDPFNNIDSNGKIKRSETALINEIGKETVIRDGEAYSFNNGYPTFAKLKKGDMVLNHKQTEDLNENGENSIYYSLLDNDTTEDSGSELGVVRDGMLSSISGAPQTGDVVFSNSQLEMLQKRGKLNSHAHIKGGSAAFANGTVSSDDNDYNIVDAFSKGTAVHAYARMSTQTNKQHSSSSAKTYTRHSASSYGSHSNNSSGGTNTKEWKKFEEYVKGLFDWIEIRLDRLEKNVDKWATKVENALTNAYKAVAMQAQISTLREQYSGNVKAAQQYADEAAAIGKMGVDKYNKSVSKDKQIKDPATWIKNIYNKLLNGSLTNNRAENIKKYGEKQAAIIDAMATWVDKQNEAEDAAEEALNSIQEIYFSLRDLANVKADEKIEDITKALTHLSKQYDLLFANSAKIRNNQLDTQTAKAAEEKAAREEAYKTTSKNLVNAQNKMATKLVTKTTSAVKTYNKTVTKGQKYKQVTTDKKGNIVTKIVTASKNMTVKQVATQKKTVSKVVTEKIKKNQRYTQITTKKDSKGNITVVTKKNVKATKATTNLTTDKKGNIVTTKYKIDIAATTKKTNKNAVSDPLAGLNKADKAAIRALVKKGELVDIEDFTSYAQMKEGAQKRNIKEYISDYNASVKANKTAKDNKTEATDNYWDTLNKNLQTAWQNLIDEMEKGINNLARQAGYLANNLGNLFQTKYRRNNINSQISKNNSQLTEYKDNYAEATSKLKAVSKTTTSKASIKGETSTIQAYIKKQVTTGKAIDITKLKTDAAIEAAIKYNNALVNSETSLETLENGLDTWASTLDSLNNQLANLENNKADETILKINDQLDLLAARYNNLSRVAADYKTKNANLDQQTQKALKTYQQYDTANEANKNNYDDSESEALKQLLKYKNKGLINDAEYNNAVKHINAFENVDIFTSWRTDPQYSDLYNSLSSFNAFRDAYDESQKNKNISYEEYLSKLSDNALTKFDNIINDFENRQQQNAHANTSIEAIMAKNAAKGFADATTYYQKLNDNNKKILVDATGRLNALKKELQIDLDKGVFEVGSDDYFQALQRINDAELTMIEIEKQTAENTEQIKNITFENAKAVSDQGDRINGELEFWQSMLSRYDMFEKVPKENGVGLEQTGNLTEAGRALMQTYAAGYSANKELQAYWNSQVDYWQEEYDKDNNNKNALARLQEAIDLRNEYTKAAYDQLDAEIEIIEKGYEAQAKSLSEQISQYQKIVDLNEEAYDYQKKISDLVKELNKTQKQLSVLSGDTSEENRANLQKLTEQLQNNQDSLEETERAKFTSDLKKMFSDLQEGFSDYTDDVIYELRNSNEMQQDLMSEIGQNTSDTNKYLAELSRTIDVSFTDNFRTIWEDSDTNLINRAANAVINAMSNMDRMVNFSESAARSETSGFKKGTPRIPYDQNAWTQEDGTEYIMRKSDGALLTPLNTGDKVFTAEMSENLWNLAKNAKPFNFNDTVMGALSDGMINNINTNNTMGDVNINFEGDFNLPNVNDPQQFLSELRSAIATDKKTQNLLVDATLGTTSGNYNALSLRKYR